MTRKNMTLSELMDPENPDAGRIRRFVRDLPDMIGFVRVQYAADASDLIFAGVLTTDRELSETGRALWCRLRS
jgi:predicted secreted protein